MTIVHDALYRSSEATILPNVPNPIVKPFKEIANAVIDRTINSYLFD